MHSSLSRKNPGILANWGYVDQIMLIGYIIAYEPMRRVRNERPWIWSLLVIMTSVCRLSWLNLQDIYWNWLVAQNTFFFFPGSTVVLCFSALNREWCNCSLLPLTPWNFTMWLHVHQEVTNLNPTIPIKLPEMAPFNYTPNLKVQ